MVAGFKLYYHSADLTKLNIIDRYKVGQADAYVTSDGQLLYVEPPMSTEAYEFYQTMMNHLFLSLEPGGRADDVSYIENHMWREAEATAKTDILSKNADSIRYYLVRDILGYGILDVLMKDENIEEITAERFDTRVGVVHRKYSEFNILDTNITFGTFEEMNSYVQKLMQKTGSTVTAAVPIMNAMTKEGDRITVTYGSEVSLPGPTLDIRKFTRQPYTITHLVRSGLLSEIMAAYLWMLIDAKAFGLVVGETGSGKTTILNALMGMANPRWKIVTIEETPELKIPHQRWERLVTRTSAMITQSKFDVTIMDLIRASLRMRPDFELVGEVRGQEAQYMFQSAATGHGGLTTFHGSSAEAALNRLESEPINIKASQQMLLWFIAHATRFKIEGRVARRIASISEVIPQKDTVELHQLFVYNQKSQKHNIDTVEELCEKSKKVHAAADVLNVEPADDLKKRIMFLQKCIELGASTNEKVFSIMSGFYT